MSQTGGSKRGRPAGQKSTKSTSLPSSPELTGSESPSKPSKGAFLELVTNGIAVHNPDPVPVDIDESESFPISRSLVSKFGDIPQVSHISRVHCAINLRQGKYYVKDLSRNGTYVNNAKIVPGVEKEIQNGDWITLLVPEIHNLSLGFRFYVNKSAKAKRGRPRSRASPKKAASPRRTSPRRAATHKYKEEVEQPEQEEEEEEEDAQEDTAQGEEKVGSPADNKKRRRSSGKEDVVSPTKQSHDDEEIDEADEDDGDDDDDDHSGPFEDDEEEEVEQPAKKKRNFGAAYAAFAAGLATIGLAAYVANINGLTSF